MNLGIYSFYHILPRGDSPDGASQTRAAGPADDALHLVTFGQQELGQVISLICVICAICGFRNGTGIGDGIGDRDVMGAAFSGHLRSIYGPLITLIFADLFLSPTNRQLGPRRVMGDVLK